MSEEFAKRAEDRGDLWTEKSLIFVDLETMGLAADAPIVEVAAVLTDGDLRELAVFDHVQPYSTPEWHSWCEPEALRMHRASGLFDVSTRAWATCMEHYPPADRTASAREKSLDAVFAAQLVMWDVAPRAGIIAGSSIHADRAWMRQQMPRTDGFLYYRMVDVTGIRQIVARTCAPDIFERLKASRPPPAHRAMDDIRATIEELRLYTTHVFAHGKLPPWDKQL